MVINRYNVFLHNNLIQRLYRVGFFSSEVLWLKYGCSRYGPYCSLYYAVRWMNFHLNAHVASGKLELNCQCVTRVRMRTIMIVLRCFS